MKMKMEVIGKEGGKVIVVMKGMSMIEDKIRGKREKQRILLLKYGGDKKKNMIFEKYNSE